MDKGIQNDGVIVLTAAQDALSRNKLPVAVH